jgi:hypothetical protein
MLRFVRADSSFYHWRARALLFSLPGYQDALVQAVFRTGVPTIVVLVHGGAIAVDWIKVCWHSDCLFALCGI